MIRTPNIPGPYPSAPMSPTQPSAIAPRARTMRWYTFILQTFPRDLIHLAVAINPKHTISRILMGLWWVVCGSRRSSFSNGICSWRKRSRGVGCRLSRSSPLPHLGEDKNFSTFSVIQNLLWRPPACNQLVSVMAYPALHHFVDTRDTATSKHEDAQQGEKKTKCFHSKPPPRKYSTPNAIICQGEF